MNIVKINGFKPAFKANIMPQEQAEHLDNKLKSAETVDIFCHAKADEDSFNSAKALFSYLESMGKTVRIISSIDPDLYKFDQKKYNVISENSIDEFTPRAELAVCVDLSKGERLKPNVLDYLHTFSNNNIVGFDHHAEDTLICPKADTYNIVKSYDSVKNMPVEEPKNYYIDSSSKSCAAIIYRFFEAIKRDIPYSEKVSLFCGMSDDMRKSGYINFLKSPKIEFSKVGQNDENTKYVYNKVLQDINETDKAEIIKHIDPLSDLSLEAKEFQKSLFDNVQISDNNKFAYIVIDVDDPLWRAVGGDNSSTRPIVKDFRARLMQNSENDELISDELKAKLKDVQVIGTIDSDFANNKYNVSLTSKGDYVKRYADFVRENFYPNLKVMGHSNRGGWSISNNDEDKCKEFFEYFMTAAQNIEYIEE